MGDGISLCYNETQVGGFAHVCTAAGWFCRGSHHPASGQHLAGPWGQAARAADNYFGDTVNELIGDYGEFDVIIHVREEVQDAAAQELERIVAEKLPQASYKKGLTVAGQANFFLSLPPELRNRGILEGLGGIVGDLPGYSGLTYIIEPAITVNNVHPGVRSELWEKMEQIPGVDFIFRQNNNLLVLLDSVDYAAQVSDLWKPWPAISSRGLPIGYAAQDEALSEKVLRHRPGA